MKHPAREIRDRCYNLIPPPKDLKQYKRSSDKEQFRKEYSSKAAAALLKQNKFARDEAVIVVRIAASYVLTCCRFLAAARNS